MTDKTNHFMRLSKLGYSRLVAITPPGCKLNPNSSLAKRMTGKNPSDPRGKAPGIKGRDGWHGYDWLKTSLYELSKWHEMGAGVGIRCGQGLAGFDVDTMSKDYAKLIYEVLQKHLGEKPIVRIGQFPKALYPLRTDPDFRYMCLKFGPADARGNRERIEILAEGRQFVAHGIHPKTGKPYQWPNGLPKYDDLPYVPSATLRAILDELRALLPEADHAQTIGAGGNAPENQSILRGDPEMVEKAVHALPNDHNFDSRDDYIRVAYALKASLPDDEPFARELWLDWCEKWTTDKNDLDVVSADFDRCNPEDGKFKVGASWLYEQAEKLGDGSFQSAEQWLEKPDEPLFPDMRPAGGGSDGAGGKPVRKFTFEKFYDAADSALTDTNEPLIEGLLDCGAMSVIYGQSNVGKTFVALDMAYSVARGLPYAGMWVRQGAVVYLSAEGGGAIKKRVAALCVKHGRVDDVPLLLLRSTIDLRRPDADLRPLIEAIRGLGVPVALIVVDTLARALAGGDENSSVDMGQIVTNFDRLRESTSAHLMIVHHSGKNVAAGARGHSSLRAATDTEIEVADGVVEVRKQRDLDGSWARGFDLEVQTLGENARGTLVTSCTVRLRDGVAVEGPAGATVTEGRLLRAIGEIEAFADDVNQGVSVAAIVAFLENTPDKMSENAARLHVKKLVQKGLLTKCLRGRWKTVQTNLDQFVDQSVFQ